MNIPMPYAIEARGLARRYGSVAALAGVDLAIERGSITALLGQNGAGKTTFVNLALGRERPDSGVFWTLGMEPGNTVARSGTGVMLQSASLVPQLTVREHVALHAGYYAHALSVDAVLELTGLGGLADRRYAALSGGQQRRVQFGIAICGRPQLLVLDEPTNALDADSRRHCWAIIKAQAATGAAVLLTTHLLDEAEALADRVVLLSQGRVIADGTPWQIRAQVSEQRIRCRTALSVAELESLPHVIAVALVAGRVDIRTSSAEVTLRALMATDTAIGELEVTRASLEDALDQLIHREAA